MALNLDANGKKIGPFTKDYTWKDAVLYALVLGRVFPIWTIAMKKI
jgi:hypothetical protein